MILSAIHCYVKTPYCTVDPERINIALCPEEINIAHVVSSAILKIADLYILCKRDINSAYTLNRPFSTMTSSRSKVRVN